VIQRGEAHPRAKLTDRDVRTMRRMYREDGLCTRCIAHLFGVAYATARQAIQGKTWTYLEDEARD
jgi:hypothetical protein